MQTDLSWQYSQRRQLFCQENFKCQTLTKEINTVPDIYASVKEIHVHLQYAHLRLGFFESHVSHRIDHCFDVLKCFITCVPIHMRGKILTFQIWRFMDNQSSLGGPLCCCEKLCVNEMLYFFCTHQLSSVLYNKHCFCGHFRALHERFFDTNYPSFFPNYDFCSRHFQFTEIIKQFDGIYFNNFFLEQI